MLALEQNVQDFDLPYFGMSDKRQGIVHIIGPEQGFTVPGCTCVCGDSHTATHGAFGALAFGIGTSEVERAPRLPLPQPRATEHSIFERAPAPLPSRTHTSGAPSVLPPRSRVTDCNLPSRELIS